MTPYSSKITEFPFSIVNFGNFPDFSIISLFYQIMKAMRKIVSTDMNMIQQLGIVRANLDGMTNVTQVS